MKRLLLLSVFCALLGSCDYFRYKEEPEEVVVVLDTTYCRIELAKTVINVLDTQTLFEPVAPDLSELLYLTDSTYKKAYNIEIANYQKAITKYLYANIYSGSEGVRYMVGNPRGLTVDITITEKDEKYEGKMRQAIMHPREAEEIAKAVQRYVDKQKKDEFCNILKIYKP